MNDEFLKLDNQVCFPFYALSRLITKAYKPLLQPLGLTYPQYLVMLILWEKNGVSVSDISKRLLLETNTLTPLLKRMEQNGQIQRDRSPNDERSVIVSLTKAGMALKQQATHIPEQIFKCTTKDKIKAEDLLSTKADITALIDILKYK